MFDFVQMVFQCVSYFVFYLLYVIDVVLYIQVGCIYVVDQIQCLLCVVQVEVWNIKCVDWFDQQINFFGFQCFCCKFQVFYKCFVCSVFVYVFGVNVYQVVELFYVEYFCVFDGFVYVVLKFVYVIWQDGDIVFVVVLVVGWQVVQDEVELEVVQVIGNLVGMKCVGEQEFYIVKVCMCGGFEVVEEGLFVEEYGQVGCQFCYGFFCYWMVRE